MKIFEIATPKKVDIDTIAKQVEFKPTSKKPLEYTFIEDANIDKMPKLSYTISDREQTIETWTSDGKETENTAKKGDIIVSGPTKEKYVLSPSKFKKNYEGDMKDTVIPEQSPREVAKYKGDTIKFTAPWDEDMIMHSGDYLVKEKDDSGYYRIAKKEYELTYNPPGTVSDESE